MKHPEFLVLIIIAVIGLGSCSREQDDPERKPDGEYRLLNLHYENSLGEKGITHFYYDLDDQNYRAVWHLLDSSRSSHNQHTFDSSGRMLTKYREFSDGITSIQEFKYDPSGKLVSENFSRSDEVKGRVDYAYGPYGRLEFADCGGLNGWFYGKIVYTWEGSEKTGAVILKDSDTIGSIIYEYEDEKLVYEKWDFKGKWNQVFRYEYQQAAPMTYSSSNVFIRESPWFRIASESYDFNGESGGPSYYEYDASGRIVSKEFIRSDGLRTYSSYEYDTTGLLDASLREYGDGSTANFLYWFSVTRKLLVKTFQWSDGTSGSETYRYKNAVMVRGEYVNVDKWLNGILDFIYREDGVLIGADYKGDDGTDADLSFFYDRNFNLEKIHWEFSSGHTQTYFYSYEPF